jgi:hypothetical protein
MKFRAISRPENFSLSPKDNLPVASHRRDRIYNRLELERVIFFHFSEVFYLTIFPFLWCPADWMVVPLEPAAAVRGSLVWLARVAQSYR